MVCSALFRCSWCMSVRNKIVLETFVGSTQVYTHYTSFSENFKKNLFVFFALLIGSIWFETLIYMVWCVFCRCSWCSSMLMKILVETAVCAKQLYSGWRSYSQHFKKLWLWIFTLRMAPIWPHGGVINCVVAGQVERGGKVKNKSQNFLKLARNELHWV